MVECLIALALFSIVAVMTLTFLVESQRRAAASLCYVQALGVARAQWLSAPLEVPSIFTVVHYPDRVRVSWISPATHEEVSIALP